MRNTDNIFSIDLDLNFQPNYIDNDLAIKVNEEAVKRSLRNLILFRKYEKPFHPEISSGIQDLLFESPSPLTYNMIKTNIEEVIRKYEPRVNELNIELFSDYNNNSVIVNIQFTIQNRPQIIETNIHMERTR